MEQYNGLLTYFLQSVLKISVDQRSRGRGGVVFGNNERFEQNFGAWKT
jgi:hypothetical protein